MDYIKGKIRNIIYQNKDNGYVVAVFRIKETNDPKMEEYVSKTVTITGIFLDINSEETFILFGEATRHERFGFQYQVKSYEKEKISSEDALIEFLSSSLIKGCGEKTAEKIVEILGMDAIEKIKNDEMVLNQIPNLSEAKKKSIRASLLEYSDADDSLLKLKELGFSILEATRIYKKYGASTKYIIESNLYVLTEIMDFNKIDTIYKSNHEELDAVRMKACMIEAMRRLSANNGDTYYKVEEIKDALKKEFDLVLDEITFEEIVYALEEENKIVLDQDLYYLTEYYDAEADTTNNLFQLNASNTTPFYDFDRELTMLEEENKVRYNEDQRNAIKKALENKITIISGGPGTGKTTIINAIVKLYIKMHDFSPMEVLANIALLAPTGRASKKMSSSTGLPAMTIHRFLKWNKDTNNFGVNEYHKAQENLIIVDEMSMIDVSLFDALLKGIKSNVQLIMVGDVFQLPSVGPGLVLNDLILSDLFTFCPLEKIYRQSDNSYIPYLALEIKNKDLSEDFVSQKDDYNFLNVDGKYIKDMIKKICVMSKAKGLNEEDIQILAPMYKGENGIDNLNVILQNLFNPKDTKKEEIHYGDVIYREGDKVLQLQNNPDNNVFNGDIGYIRKIIPKSGKNKDLVLIDFEGVKVEYSKEELNQIKHAYAITIHKSQGSEFSHVILPISRSYYKMLYNKLIYTGVSRAKKSLVIIGEANAFMMAVNNDYASSRKTMLKEKLMNKFMQVR
ncbi:helicase RecD/TraA family [Mycoplasma sp. CAG:776]|nr:helicase RecD/TraA family [Mycoplasma sp. CAG:776]